MLLGIATIGCGHPPADGYVRANLIYGCTGYANLPHISIGKDLENTLRQTMFADADPKDPLCWYERCRHPGAEGRRTMPT